MFSEYSRRKRHNASIYIRPNASVNTSVRPKDFMKVRPNFQNAADVLDEIERNFNFVVKNTRNQQMGLIKPASFDFSVRYNGRVNSDNISGDTHRFVYTVSINKQRNSNSYGYNIHVYFIPLDEIESCEQKPMHFIATLKDLPKPVVNRSTDRRVNDGKPAVKQLTKPNSAVGQKICQLMYKIEAPEPYFVATVEEAEWLYKKHGFKYGEASVVNVFGSYHELGEMACIKSIDMNDYTKNYIYKNKASVPDGFKCKQYKVNGNEIVYSNMLIDDAVEGVYDMVGKKNGMLIVVIHRSFLGDVREVIYTEDESEMVSYKDKYINRRKVS